MCYLTLTQKGSFVLHLIRLGSKTTTDRILDNKSTQLQNVNLYSGVQLSNNNSAIMYHFTGSGKSKMTAYKLEIRVYQLVHKLTTNS